MNKKKNKKITKFTIIKIIANYVYLSTQKLPHIKNSIHLINQFITFNQFKFYY